VLRHCKELALTISIINNFKNNIFYLRIIGVFREQNFGNIRVEENVQIFSSQCRFQESLCGAESPPILGGGLWTVEAQ